MMKRKYVALIVLLVFSSAGSIAQHIRFNHFTIEDGLSQSTVYDIYQDSLGFTWLATQDGLNRFDGTRFKVYKHKGTDSLSLKNNFVNVIAPGENMNLWIGTLEGVSLYNYKLDNFRNNFSKGKDFDRLQSSVVEDIFTDESGTIWFAGTKGLFSYQQNIGVEHFPFLDTIPTSKSIYKVHQISSEKLLLGTSHGPFVFNRTSGEFSLLEMNFSDDRISTDSYLISDICEGDRGIIHMAATGDGIISFNPETNQAEMIKHDSSSRFSLEDELIVSLNIGPQGKLWAGTYSGLQVINLQDSSVKYLTHKSYQPKSIGRGEVTAVYFDKAVNTWVGTSGGGISIYAPSKNKFHHEQKQIKDPGSLPTNMVMDLLKEKDETVWVATDGGGLHKYLPNKDTYKTYNYQRNNPASLNSSYILSVAKDLSGQIWAGTYGWGVNLYNKQKDNFKRFPTEHPLGELNDKTINQIFQGSDSTMWFATMSGLFYYEDINQNGTHLISEKSNPSLPHNQVWDIYEDSQGYIWVGTMKGMARMGHDKKVEQVYHKNETDSLSLPSSSVNCFAEDYKNQLWLGTDAGICRYDRGRDLVIPYYDRYGLPDGVIYGLLHHDEELWISTNNGLYKFNTKQKKVWHFTENDGIQSSEFNSGAAYKAADNEMFFGGIDGYNRFYPDSITISDYNPNIVITNLQLFNEDLPVGTWKGREILKKPIYLADQLELSYSDQVITFEFASMDMASPEDIRYKYIMEGFDKTWTTINKNKPVTYTNLPPGKYKFVVKGTNADGVWSNDTASIKIKIAPPFYQKTWFIVTVILIIIALIFFIIKIRERRLNKEKLKLERLVAQRTRELTRKNEELEEHRNNLETLVKKRTADLQKAKEEAEESDRLKTAFLANMSHEIRTPMNAIVGFSDILHDTDISEEERLGYIKLIHDSSNKLLHLIDEIVDLARLESDDIRLSSDSVEVNGFIDGLVRETEEDLRDTGKKDVLQVKKSAGSNTDLYVSADRNRLHQVMHNLISNAIKFTKQGAITIGYSLKSNDIELFVEDTGIGIEPEKHELIFQRFRQLDDSHTRKFGGTGLGLSLVKSLLERMGTQIHVESTYGEGSRFSFALPLLHTSENENKISEKQTSEMIPDLKGKIILIAENTEFNRLYLHKVLKTTGAELTVANDGRTIYDEVMRREGNVDLILMDLDLPLMSGKMAAEKIKGKYSGIYIIAQIVNESEKEIAAAQGSGCDGYLVKPIRKNKLFSVIREVLST